MASGVNTTCKEKIFSILYSLETASFLAIFEYSDEHGKGRKVLFCVTVLATARPWFLKPAACGCVQAGGTHLQLPHFCFGRPWETKRDNKSVLYQGQLKRLNSRLLSLFSRKQREDWQPVLAFKPHVISESCQCIPAKYTLLHQIQHTEGKIRSHAGD